MMKKLFVLLFFALAALMTGTIVLGLAAGVSSPVSPVPSGAEQREAEQAETKAARPARAEYYGSWDCGPYPVILTITADTLDFRDIKDGDYYTLDKLQWEAIAQRGDSELKMEHPFGYTVTGRIRDKKGRSDIGDVGSAHSIFLYLHVSKERMVEHHPGFYYIPYIRIPAPEP
jgi:hypothetical protein